MPLIYREVTLNNMLQKMLPMLEGDEKFKCFIVYDDKVNISYFHISKDLKLFLEEAEPKLPVKMESKIEYVYLQSDSDIQAELWADYIPPKGTVDYSPSDEDLEAIEALKEKKRQEFEEWWSKYANQHIRDEEEEEEYYYDYSRNDDDRRATHNSKVEISWAGTAAELAEDGFFDPPEPEFD